jgi:hypothetical protein
LNDGSYVDDIFDPIDGRVKGIRLEKVSFEELETFAGSREGEKMGDGVDVVGITTGGMNSVSSSEQSGYDCSRDERCCTSDTKERWFLGVLDLGQCNT